MAEQYRRAQILLEPEQYSTLAQIARRDRRSVSDVVREILHLGLELRKKQTKERLRALNLLSTLRDQIQKRHGVLTASTIEEARKELDMRTHEMLK